jgi:hypothetical protein
MVISARIALSLLVLAVTATGCDRSPTRGLTKEQVVSKYIDAMQRGDREEIVKLNNPQMDQLQDIDKRLAAIGNRQWRNVKIEWHVAVDPNFPVATITATSDNGSPIKDMVGLATVDGLWYLDLGARTPRPGDVVSPSAT